ncbi:pentatricopeptide repeat-containing protein At3g22670, mitochondrial [Ziziphus jujuba]|uniref:Pentatricopeptide repeat-containing protein At3g22670, mitochondrial n=1 Tax=Ziziphus jujuba TaxID=326968 RepID=A0A6P4A3E3_ZIZJJ|nr:pentatricopeptide repeat-containing protein At3g22670, mitochondrial [Ziziphus jujuba]
MLSKLHAQRLFTIPKANKCALQYLFNPLCTTTESTQLAESPKLPPLSQLFKTKGKVPPAEDSDDDFVIPSLANWVETRKLDDNHDEDVKRYISESTDSDLDEISKILQNRYPSPENVVQALKGCSFNVTDSMVERLLKRYNNDWVPAFGVFNWAKEQTDYKHSPQLYNSIVEILGKAKKFRLMWELVEEMDQLGGYISLLTMAKVIRKLARAGMYKEAIEAFQGIEKYGVKKDVSALNILVEALVKENSVENAHEVVSDIQKSIPLNAHTYNILIYGWCKARKLDNAKKTMEEMERNGFCPDVVSYTCLIKSYCGDKDFRKVDKILDEMQEKGCKPNIITYTVIMHALGKAKEITAALGVYERMKKDGCVPDAPFYSSLIYTLSTAGRLKDARDVFEDMPNQGVTRDLLTYNTMITCLCGHSQEEAALKLLKQMVEEDYCKPDLKTYAPLLKMCCRKKRMKVLSFLLNHMLKNDVSIEAGTYSLLVNQLWKNGKVEEACSFFEEMVSKGFVLKDSTFKMLKEGLEAKNMVEARKKIEELMCQANNK